MRAVRVCCWLDHFRMSLPLPLLSCASLRRGSGRPDPARPRLRRVASGGKGSNQKVELHGESCKQWRLAGALFASIRQRRYWFGGRQRGRRQTEFPFFQRRKHAPRRRENTTVARPLSLVACWPWRVRSTRFGPYPLSALIWSQTCCRSTTPPQITKMPESLSFCKLPRGLATSQKCTVRWPGPRRIQNHIDLPNALCVMRCFISCGAKILFVTMYVVRQVYLLPHLNYNL